MPPNRVVSPKLKKAVEQEHQAPNGSPAKLISSALISDVLDDEMRRLVARLRTSEFYPNLYLITSNPVKIAHYGCIFDALGLALQTYSTPLSGYVEDHHLTPSEAIRQSVKRASASLNRLGLFFIDDSSFVINALSEGGSEFPGLRTKAFLDLHRTPASLAGCLKACGEELGAQIISRIGLHIPGTSLPEVFDGRTHGRISPTPHISPVTHLPWLEERSPANFFVPDGEDIFLSCLSISSSVRHDTRVKASLLMLQRIEQLMAFSSHRSAVIRTRSAAPVAQRTLFSPYILAISGYSGAGKTTSRNYLHQRYGIQQAEMSDIVREEAERVVGQTSDLVAGADMVLSRHGPTHFIEQVLRRSIGLRNGPAVIAGIRSPLEIEFLRGKYRCHVLFLDVPTELRYLRWSMGRHTRDSLRSDFVRLEESEIRWGMQAIAQQADFLVRNTGNISVLRMRLDKIMEQIGT